MEEENPIDLVSFLKDKSRIPIRKNTRTPDYNIELNTGYGDSKYDENFYPDAEINTDREGLDLVSFINENRALKQPSLIKAGAGVLRAGSKALQEIAKMPGVVGGLVMGATGQINDAITGEDNTDFIKTAFDNKWVQTINDFGESINKDVLPVYVSKSVTEGNLWDNISSIDFWATEGADGLGYIISMLAPGAAISKLGVGSKLIQGVSKFGKFNDKTVRAAEKLAELGLPTNAKNIDLYSQTLANTLFEAGAEAQSAMESYKQDLDAKLQEGLISKTEYDVRLEKQSEVGRNVFVTNAAILVGPNAIMSKMLWGKARNKVAGSIIDDAGNITKLKDPSILRRVKLYGDDFGKAALREGFFEEGLQSTTEDYFKNNPDSNLLDFIGDIPKAYIDMLGTTEGQKAILLGAAFGGGMQAFTGGRSRSQERKTTNNLIDLGNSALSDMYNVFNEDVYVKDNNGNIIYEDNNPKIDYKKVQDKLKSQDSLESLSALYDAAIENNDKNTIEQIKDLVTTNLVKPFIVNDELGIDVLKQHLELSKDIEAISDREKQDKQTYINNIISKAEKLQTDYNSFQDYAEDLINLKNGNQSQRVDFYNKLSMQYLDSKSRQYYLENKLNELNKKYSDLVDSKGMDKSILKDNARLQNELNNDIRFKKVSDDIKNVEKSLESVRKTNDSFWDGISIQKAFDKELREAEKINKEVETESQKADEQINQITSAETKEELDNINSSNPVVNSKIQERKDEIDQQIDQQIESQTQESINKSEEIENQKDDELDELSFLAQKIGDNYNPGELVPDDILKGTEYENEPVVIVSNNENSIVLGLIERGGEEITIDKVRSKNIKSNTDNNFVTEGSENHDALTPINEEIKDPEAKSGTKLLSTDRDGKKVFDNISDLYLAYEKVPRDKRGEEVGFEINMSDFNNKNWTQAQKIYNKLIQGNLLDDVEIETLINYLPINVIVKEGITAPIETYPSSTGRKSKDGYTSQDIFNMSAKVLRTNIINSLIAGNKIEDIKTTIEGQYPGVLKVEPGVPENSITDLFHLQNLSEKDKLENIKSNIAFVNDKGDLEHLDGRSTTFNKSNAKGELYLMIPKSNGEQFPLKLNIKKITDKEADLLYDLFNLRLKESDINRSTTLAEIEDKELVKKIKESFAEEIKLIGIAAKDITIRDIVDFFVYSNGKSVKSILQFKGAGKGKSQLVYGKISDGGGRVEMGGQLDKEAFTTWLTNFKRHSISFKPKKNQAHNATININDNYLKYLLDNKILNTNAVVNKPTFGGYSNIYLDSNNITVSGKPSSEPSTNIKDDRTPEELKLAESKEIRAIVEPVIQSEMKKGVSPLQALTNANQQKASEIENIKNKYENIRISQNNFVSSQDKPNTEDNKVIKEKQEAVKNKDVINVSDAVVQELFKLLLDNNLVKMGTNTKKLLQGSNKEVFEKLKEIADKNKLSISEIETKCK